MRFVCATEEESERAGREIARTLAPDAVVHLSGDLGAGKTTVTRGLVRALGHAGRVKSPTYTLVEPYELSSLHFYHFDFYRLKNKEEWEGAGFREYFNAQSLCVVEWPERAAGLLYPPDVEITLLFDGEARRARMDSYTEAGRAWLSSLRY